MPIPADQLNARLRTAFPEATIVVEDMVGDQDHYRVKIVDPAFKGLSRIRQHQLVNKALADLLSGPLHAMALETAAPSD